MTPERYERARELFHAAVDLTEDQRGAFLDRRCVGDAELRSEVEGLLASSRRASSFLDPATVPVESPLIGRTIGRYRVVRELAQGGMGTVYEALQDEPQRRVALKVLRAGALGRNAASRFRHEAQILARLTHPAIAQVHEAGTHDDGSGQVVYFTLELVEDAASITDYCRGHGLGTARRLELFLSCCDAVEHAHQRGVIHRDLKPSNILIDGTGQTKVLDFGLAKLTRTDILVTSMRTESGQLLGTIPYMSPEQVGGDPTDIDTRSDVYALGVILYELLTGRLPHNAPSLPETVRAIQQDEPSRLSSFDRELRGDLETITAKALDKDRTRRYQSVAALAEDIRRFLRHEAIRARPPSALYTFRKFARRNRGLVAGTAIAFMALVAGLGIAVWQAVAATRARDRLAVEQKRSQAGEYIATIAAAESALRSGDAAEASTHLEAAPSGLRNWEWWELRGKVDQSERTLTEATAEVGWLVLTPDGSLLIAVTGRKIHGFDTGTWQRVWVIDYQRDADTPPTISRDGQRLIVAGQDGAILWRLQKDRPPERAPGFDQNLNARMACFIEDGTAALFVSDSGDLFEWRAGAVRGVGFAPRVTALTASPDGTRAAICTDHGPFLRDSSGVLSPLGDSAGAAVAAAFSRDGSLLAVARLGRTITVWSLRGEHPVKVTDLSGAPTEIASMTILPDNTRLAVSSKDRGIRVWRISDGGEPQVLTGHRRTVNCVASLPDGRIASASDDRTIKLWKLDAIPPSDLPGHAAFFTPDGTLFALHGNQRLKWRAGDGARVQPIQGSEVWNNPSEAVECSGRVLVGAAGASTGFALFDVEDGSARMVVGPGTLEGAISPDGRRVAHSVALGGGIVRDITTGATLIRWDDSSINRLRPMRGRFSPDGKRISTVSTRGTVVIRNSEDGSPVLTLRGHQSDVRCIAFSRDGRLIATGSLDNTARIWDAATGQELHILRGHAAQVEAADFSPDSTRLATGAFDGVVRLWDVREGKAVATLHALTPEITCVRFSPDGSVLVAADDTNRVRNVKVSIWHAGSEARRLALSLLEELILPERVVDRLRADLTVPASLRDDAIAVARAARPDPSVLNSRAWAVAGFSGSDAASYERAVHIAEAACQLSPGNGYYLNTLGAAQYRLGRYREALGTLEEAERRNGGIPPDVAFIVMCRVRLGELARAESDMARLRGLFGSAWEGGEPAALAVEAQTLLDAALASRKPTQ